MNNNSTGWLILAAVLIVAVWAGSNFLPAIRRAYTIEGLVTNCTLNAGKEASAPDRSIVEDKARKCLRERMVVEGIYDTMQDKLTKIINTPDVKFVTAAEANKAFVFGPPGPDGAPQTRLGLTNRFEDNYTLQFTDEKVYGKLKYVEVAQIPGTKYVILTKYEIAKEGIAKNQ